MADRHQKTLPLVAPLHGFTRRVAQTVGNHWSGSADIDGVIACKAWMPAFEMLRELVVEHGGAHL